MRVLTSNRLFVWCRLSQKNSRMPSSPSAQILLLLCGLSGAGHSSAHHSLSDLGFFAVDNLPFSLLNKFLSLVKLGGDKRFDKVSLFLPVDSTDDVDAYREKLLSLRQEPSLQTVLLFLEANHATILKRYSETRRPHPRFDPLVDQTLSDTLEREQLLLHPLRAISDHVIDTSELSIHQFRREIQRFVSSVSVDTKPRIRVNIFSFGFKHGAPSDCDLLIDVRFLQNPHFVEHLRPKVGLDKEVADFVLHHVDAVNFLGKYTDLLTFLIPRYAFEGKAYLNIGVGCTGGRHRSVAIAEALARRISLPDIFMSVGHRDIEK